MKQKCGTLFIVICLFFSTSISATEKLYGKELSAALSIRIADLTSNPEKYVDKLVKVEGLVDDVCPMKGCWVDIIESQSTETIRFKVQDDVIVFPVSATGQSIVAEGVLKKHSMSKDQAVRWLRHLAEEKGEIFDETSVTAATVFYQIEGVGATVRDLL